MELLPISFLQTAHGGFPSFLTFVPLYWLSTLHRFDSSGLFQAGSFHFELQMIQKPTLRCQPEASQLLNFKLVFSNVDLNATIKFYRWYFCISSWSVYLLTLKYLFCWRKQKIRTYLLNSDFVIFMQFLAIFPKLSSTHKPTPIGNSIGWFSKFTEQQPSRSFLNPLYHFHPLPTSYTIGKSMGDYCKELTSLLSSKIKKLKLGDYIAFLMKMKAGIMETKPLIGSRNIKATFLHLNDIRHIKR